MTNNPAIHSWLNSESYRSLKEDINVSYTPHLNRTEIKIVINNEHMKAFHQMLTFVNVRAREHIKHMAKEKKANNQRKKERKVKVAAWKKEYEAFSLYGHKLRLKHGEKAQEQYITSVSKYKDRTSLKSYKLLGQTLYNRRKLKARNKRIQTMANNGIKKQTIAQYFGIKPPTVSNIIKKATL